MEKVNTYSMMSKFRSKSELYNVLTMEGGYYLPPRDNIDLFFLRQLCMKQKKVGLISYLTVRPSREKTSTGSVFLIMRDFE